MTAADIQRIEQADRELAADGKRAAARWEAVASDNRVPEMKIFQVHLRTGRMVNVCAGSYRQEGGEHVFYGSARILEPPRRGMPVRVESREERMERLHARPAPDAVVVFAGTDVESVVELPPPPPPVYALVADVPPWKYYAGWAITRGSRLRNMIPNSKAFEAGQAEARRDIAAGRLRLHYGVAGDWGRDLKDSLFSRFGIELVELSCLSTEEARLFVGGYNAMVTAHIDGIFGPGSVAAANQEVQCRRKDRYDKWVARQKAAQPD
jgi:hypothetical protein